MPHFSKLWKGLTFSCLALFLLLHSQVLAQVKPSSGLEIHWSEAHNIPSYVQTSNLIMDWESENLEARAYQFLEAHVELYQIETSREQFQLIDQSIDTIGMSHLSFEQHFSGVPVFGSSLRFHFKKEGQLSSVNGDYLPEFKQSTSPSVSAKEALKTLKAYANETIELERESLLAELVASGEKIEVEDVDWATVNIDYSTPELTIYDPSFLFPNKKQNPRLAWKLDYFYEDLLIGEEVFLDAQSGELIESFNTLAAAKDLETYVYLSCDTVPTTPSYDANGLVSSATPDTQAENANTYAGYAYDYFDDKFGRDSYDSNGGTVESYTHFERHLGTIAGTPICRSVRNVFWIRPDNIILYGEDYVALDVTGHEFTHGVSYASPRLLYGSHDAGNLHESYSDVFGFLVEAEYGSMDWEIGEDLPNGAIRDLSDATHMNNYVTPSSPYTNVGIPNHAFYLMLDGSSIGSSISRDTAAQIYYSTLVNHLPRNATFTDAYQQTMQTCFEFYEADPSNYPSSTCETIFDGFDAVGMATDTSLGYTTIAQNKMLGLAPLTVTFDGSNSFAVNANVTSYEWDFDIQTDSDGDGVTDNDVDATGPVRSNTFTNEGRYFIRLTMNTDDGSSYSATTHVTVARPMEAVFTVSGDGTSAPATVSFDASGSFSPRTITDYSWDFGDGNSSSSGSTATTSHNYSNDGYYTVTLTITDSLGRTSSYQESVFIGSTNPTLVGGTICNDIWTTAWSPYVVSRITVQSGCTLTIEPGVVVKFLSSSSNLDIEGTLDAQGTSASPIVFTSYYDDNYGGDTNGDGSSTSPLPGDWRTIYFDTGSTGTLDYNVVSYGGSNSSTDYGMVEIYSDDVTISNSTLSDSDAYNILIESATPSITNNLIENGSLYGVFIDSASPNLISNIIQYNLTGIYSTYGSPFIDSNVIESNTTGIALYRDGATLTNNTLIWNTSYPLYINSAANNLISGNTASNNLVDGILLTNSLYSGHDLTLSTSLGLTVVIDNVTIPSSSTLTIEPGVTVKFLNSNKSLTVEGTLTAQGSSSSPVVFTSLKDDNYGGDTNNDGSATTPTANDWRQIHFDTGSSGIIDHAVVSYGGYNGSSSNDYGMVEIDSDNVIVSSSALSDSDYHNIRINSASPIIENNTIENASLYGVYTQYGAPTIDSNILQNNTIGLYTKYDQASITNNIFNSNSNYPVYINGPANNSISGNSASNNSVDGIVIYGSLYGGYDLTLSSSLSLPVVIDSITVPSSYTLTIEPGVILKFLGSGDTLTIEGTLDAQGSSSSPIIFTSIKDDAYGGDTNVDGYVTIPQASDWRTIHFDTGSTGTVDHTIISYGGYNGSGSNDYAMVEVDSDSVSISNSSLSDSDYHNIRINSASPTIENNTIENAGLHGLYTSYGTPIIDSNTFQNNTIGLYTLYDQATITNNTFDSNSSYPVYISGAYDNSISGNSASNNSADGIVVAGSFYGSNDLTLSSSLALPIIIDSVTVPSASTFTIEPGVVLKFLHTNDTITVNGTLDAQGSSSNPIIFTSLKDDNYGGDTNNDGSATSPAANNWRTIHFDTGSTGILDHTIIAYGGDNNSGNLPMIEIDSSSVSISNSTLSESDYHNIRINSVSPTIQSNTIQNAGSSGIYTQGGAPSIDSNILTGNAVGIYAQSSGTPTITNNQISGNSSYGISGGSSSWTVTAENNWWGDASGPYHLTNNPSGTGDRVSDHIDFDPWLTSP